MCLWHYFIYLIKGRQQRDIKTSGWPVIIFVWRAADWLSSWAQEAACLDLTLVLFLTICVSLSKLLLFFCLCFYHLQMGYFEAFNEFLGEKYLWWYLNHINITLAFAVLLLFMFCFALRQVLVTWVTLEFEILTCITILSFILFPYSL